MKPCGFFGTPPATNARSLRKTVERAWMSPARMIALVVGFGTAITDEHLRIRLGGYLGERLRQTLGVWIEEFAPPAAPDLAATGAGIAPPVTLEGDAFGGSAEGSVWSEVVRVEDAETLAQFTGGALDGWPAVTRRPAGAGAAWYVATLPEPGALQRLSKRVLTEAGVELPFDVTPGEQLELVRRGGLLFAINHGPNDAALQVDGTDLLSGRPTRGLTLSSQGVAIIES